MSSAADIQTYADQTRSRLWTGGEMCSRCQVDVCAGAGTSRRKRLWRAMKHDSVPFSKMPSPFTRRDHAPTSQAAPSSPSCACPPSRAWELYRAAGMVSTEVRLGTLLPLFSSFL